MKTQFGKKAQKLDKENGYGRSRTQSRLSLGEFFNSDRRTPTNLSLDSEKDKPVRFILKSILKVI